MINPDDHVLEYVDAYLHDALLSRRDAEQVAAHCEACPICRVALEEARRRQEAMQSLPPIEAPEALIRAALERVDRQRVYALEVDSRGIAGGRRRAGPAGHGESLLL